MFEDTLDSYLGETESYLGEVAGSLVSSAAGSGTPTTSLRQEAPQLTAKTVAAPATGVVRPAASSAEQAACTPGSEFYDPVACARLRVAAGAKMEVPSVGGTAQSARTSAPGGTSSTSTLPGTGPLPPRKSEVVFVPDVVPTKEVPPGAVPAAGSVETPTPAEPPPTPPASGGGGGGGIVLFAAAAAVLWFLFAKRDEEEEKRR